MLKKVAGKSKLSKQKLQNTNVFNIETVARMATSSHSSLAENGYSS